MDTKDVKARKEHKCTYCALPIDKKSTYKRVSITPWSHPDNESFDVWRVHLDCYEPGNRFFWDEDARGIFPEQGYSKEFLDFKKNQKEVL